MCKITDFGESRPRLVQTALAVHFRTQQINRGTPVFLEGPEGVKWELGLAYFSPGKMGFRSLGLGFGYWEWEESVKNGNGINIL